MSESSDVLMMTRTGTGATGCSSVGSMTLSCPPDSADSPGDLGLGNSVKLTTMGESEGLAGSGALRGQNSAANTARCTPAVKTQAKKRSRRFTGGWLASPLG